MGQKTTVETNKWEMLHELYKVKSMYKNNL